MYLLMYVYMVCALQELGCSANEKSLERNLGEMQKKHFKHTNARYNTEDQLDNRNLRTWQLRDLCMLQVKRFSHIVKESIA